MIKSVIWIDDKRKLKSVEVTMSTEMDWDFARHLQSFLANKVREFKHSEGEQEDNKITH
jgi:hypothetical protein